ncbi:MAG TPA: DASS family sodium-coupled anion symporter [Nitrospiraceae bacterium]|nr:DASS family sodium-coupled anion symporter [Nitrospiraceae bacterium]
MQDALVTDRTLTTSTRTSALALILGPLAAACVYFMPIPQLTAHAHALAAILTWVVIYWITEPIPLPMTALLGTAFCVLAGLGTAKSVFASYGHPIIFLFIGSFLIAEAMVVHGVDRKVAEWILSWSWVGARPSRILFALGAVTAVMSMWISNTAATAMMLPIGLGVLGTLQRNRAGGGRHQTAFMLMLSYAATAGGMATIVGTPPNLIGVGLIAEQAGMTLSFVTWMAFGLPLSLAMLLCAWLLLGWLNPPHATEAAHAAEEMPLRGTAVWTRGQINACIAFGMAVVLWIVPGVLEAVLGSEHDLIVSLNAHLPNELVALLAAGLLFVLPTDLRTGAFTLNWKQAANINWGIILLFGGGLAFGDLMTKTGLSDAVGLGFVNLFGTSGVWSLTAVAILAGVLISELASNTASAAMLIPLVIAIAQADGVSAVVPALGACLGASLGFALPVSTPPNAIVYGTGLIAMRSMIRAGVIFDIVGAILIWLTLRIVCPLVGLV